MKARVKATGEIVEVDFHMETKRGKMFGEVTDSRRLCKPDMTYRKFYRDEIEFLSYEDREVIDYWTRLEHQAAIGAIQGILSNPELFKATAKNAEEFGLIVPQAVAIDANCFAHTLVEKMKEKEDRI
jgi:hypothetical protein